MPQQTGNVWHSPLHECERCFFTYHISELVWQRGQLVCTAHCADNPDIWWRQRYIAAVLATGDELKPDPRLTNPQTSLEEY